MTNWLYGTSSNESTPPTPTPSVPKPEGLADLKQQLGLEQKVATTANVVEQLGVSQNTAPTASLTEQLNFGQNPTLTAEQQAKQKQLQQQLHGAYYQQLVNPQPQQSDTEERIKEKQEEQETQQQRMDRLEQEDLQKKQKEEEKKQPVAVDQAQNMEKHRGSMG
jgi:hypothetical protein